jgi:hypothetical protein
MAELQGGAKVDLRNIIGDVARRARRGGAEFP